MAVKHVGIDFARCLSNLLVSMKRYLFNKMMDRTADYEIERDKISMHLLNL
jgi:hypothetical protein